MARRASVVQHELTKLTNSYWYYYEPPFRHWAEESRPLPKNMEFVPFYEDGKYDLAILHLDQACVNEDDKKGDPFRHINRLVKKTPCVVIQHGTPYYPECNNFFNSANLKQYGETKAFEMHKQMIIDKTKEYIGDRLMVVNSKQAAKEWGFGYPIIHGMSPDEWVDLPKEVRVVSGMSPGGYDYYYNRKLFGDIRLELAETGINLIHYQVNTKFKSLNAYKEHLGSSLIYLETSRQSPMPRARTEALLSGACVVSTNHHDIGDYMVGAEFEKNMKGHVLGIKNLEEAEIVFIDDYNHFEATEKIEWLLENPDKAVKIGQKGKKKAQEVFNITRYQEQWHKLLTKIGVIK